MSYDEIYKGVYQAAKAEGASSYEADVEARAACDMEPWHESINYMEGAES